MPTHAIFIVPTVLAVRRQAQIRMPRKEQVRLASDFVDPQRGPGGTARAHVCDSIVGRLGEGLEGSGLRALLGVGARKLRVGGGHPAWYLRFSGESEAE